MRWSPRCSRSAGAAREPDVGETLRQVAALAGPALEERKVALRVDAPRERATTSAPSHAVRLALSRVLLNVGERLASETVGEPLTVEVGGADPADESVRLLRCTLRSTPAPVVRLDLPGRRRAAWPAARPGRPRRAARRRRRDPARR
jgi:hypothetical protein